MSFVCRTLFISLDDMFVDINVDLWRNQLNIDFSADDVIEPLILELHFVGQVCLKHGNWPDDPAVIDGT